MNPQQLKETKNEVIDSFNLDNFNLDDLLAGDCSPELLTDEESKAKERIVLAELVCPLIISDANVTQAFWAQAEIGSIELDKSTLDQAWYDPIYWENEIARIKSVIIKRRYIIPNMNIAQLCQDTGINPEIGFQPLLGNLKFGLSLTLGNPIISDSQLLDKLDQIEKSVYIDAIIKRDNQVKSTLEVIQVNLNKWVEGSMNFSNAGALAGFVENLLKQYFTLLAPVDARYVIAQYLSQHGVKVADDKMALKAVFKSSGLYFHKLLQLMAGNLDEDNEMKQVLMEMLDNLSPLDKEYMDDICSKVRKKMNIQDLEIEKPLGFASVGCAYLCKSRGTGKSYVLKIIRPHMVQRAERDKLVLLQVAKSFGEGIKNTIDSLCDNINSELSLIDEARKQTQGSVYRDMDVICTVDWHVSLCNKLGVCDVIGEASQDFMLQAVAPGKTVKACFDEENTDCGKLLINLFSLCANWVKEALLGNGYVHCDLHSGNMLYDDTLAKLTIIDFGNCIRFTNPGQKIILRMMISAELKLENDFFDNFKDMIKNEYVKLQKEDKILFEKKIKNIIANNEDPIKAILDVLNLGLDKGLKIPQGIVSFARSAAMLNDTLRVAGEQVHKNEIMLSGIFKFDSSYNYPIGYTFGNAVSYAFRQAGYITLANKVGFSLVKSSLIKEIMNKYKK